MIGATTEDARDTDLVDLLAQVLQLRDEVAQEAPQLLARWDCAAGDAPQNLRNLADYVALRHHDLCDLQDRLRAYGLSSMGASEASAGGTLGALIATLQRLCGDPGTPYPPFAAMTAGRDALAAARTQIFGPSQRSAHSFVMATLPTEAASDASLAEALVKAGMDCARINCAHDSPGEWARMIDNVRKAGKHADRHCRIFMDIAGPKCRIASLRAPDSLRLHRGDRVMLCADLDSMPDDVIAIAPNFPEIVGTLNVGDEVWINDGKIGARVKHRKGDHATLEVFSARKKGERLKLDKGLNFPNLELSLSPLTAKDFADLDFVAAHADIVGFSFVQRASDVALLQDELSARRPGQAPLPLVLKIETPLAVKNLPALLCQSIRRNPTAVMIARGDLAVELGFARLTEIQEEILWLCEAAHTPVIWATQVLDQFVKEGVLIRAEMTDAGVAQRADCVMLNKGPYLAEGVAILHDILGRMDRHHAKKAPRLTPLAAW